MCDMERDGAGPGQALSAFPSSPPFHPVLSIAPLSGQLVSLGMALHPCITSLKAPPSGGGVCLGVGQGATSGLLCR